MTVRVTVSCISNVKSTSIVKDQGQGDLVRVTLVRFRSGVITHNERVAQMLTPYTLSRQ